MEIHGEYEWNFMTFHILGRVAPADELIFFTGVGIPPTRKKWINGGIHFFRGIPKGPNNSEVFVKYDLKYDNSI